MYKPYRLYPELFISNFKEEWLHPEFISILKNTKENPYLKRETDDVYSFSCLSDNFLDMFNKEIKNYYKFYL